MFQNNAFIVTKPPLSPNHLWNGNPPHPTFVLTKIAFSANLLWNGSPSHPIFILTKIAFSSNRLWNGCSPYPNFILTKIAFSSSLRCCPTPLFLHNSTAIVGEGTAINSVPHPCPSITPSLISFPKDQTKKSPDG